MNQISLATTGFELVIKRTCKSVFLDEMNLVVPWTELVGLIRPFAASGTGVKGGHPSFAVETMLRIHFLQQWFGLSDPAMEEALHDVSLYCEFARLDPGSVRLPDETTILRFRHLLKDNNLSIQLLAAINATLATRGLMLKTGTVVDATLIAAPSSTKNVFTIFPFEARMSQRERVMPATSAEKNLKKSGSCCKTCADVPNPGR